MNRPPSTTNVALLSTLVVVTFWLFGWLGLEWLVRHDLLESSTARLLGLGLLALLGLMALAWLLINRTLISVRWAALAERESQRGRKIVEAAADAIITFDSLGHIESFNAAACRLFGYTPDEVLGKPISMLIVADDSSQIESLVNEAVPTWDGRVLPDNALFKGRHKSGQLIAIELGVSKIIDDDRKVFVQIIRDLTERQLAEKQRRLQYEVALQLNSARDMREAGPALLQAIGRALGWPVGLLWEVDPAQGILRCQAGWTSMERGRPLIESLSQGLLRSGEGMPGRVWLQREYRWVDDIARDPSLPCVGIAIKAGLQGALALPIELEKQMLGVVEFYAPRLPCPDATLLNTLYPVLLQVAQFIRRRWDEASLRLAKEAAEAANKAKSEFLSSISHEVRTPLHGIIGLTEILLSGELQDSQREYLRLVQSSSDTLLSLINDMLDFGKLEAARMTLEEVPFEIRPTLEANLKTFSVQAEQRGLIFRWHISPEVPGWLVGDPLRFQQVILNLVGNAIKFTPLGEVTLSLDVVARTSREVVLRGAVRDTGIGIPQDQLEAIFEAFRQVDGSRARRYGGTGLGLTIASRLIALMNGRIWVESSLGAGSTFHFTVCMGNTEPMPLPGNSANWEQPADWTATEQDPVVTGKRILVAEDNPVNRIVLQLILDRRGHQLLWANNGREAVRMYQESRIDLVLMDVQLPEMDGVEATREIIALSKQKQMKPWIVGLTAHASEDDRKRCLEAGMVRYITKPVQPADLLHALDDVFRATIVPGQGSPTS